MNYSNQVHKLAQARRCLMLPHAFSCEDYSIYEAFTNCSHAFHDLDVQALDELAQELIKEIQELMDPTGTESNPVEVLFLAKARTLSHDDRIRVSRCVDELANWFTRRSLECC